MSSATIPIPPPRRDSIFFIGNKEYGDEITTKFIYDYMFAVLAIKELFSMLRRYDAYGKDNR